MTLITTGNSDGVTGRCDAKCYNATGPDCDCVCGGRNHGAGLEQAQENTKEHAERIVEEWSGEHPEEKVIFDPIQAELF